MRGIVLAIALGLVVAACGDDAATTSTPPVTEPTTTTGVPATTTTGAPTTTTHPPATTITSTTTTTVAPTTTQAPAGVPDGAPPILAAGPNGIEILGDRVLIPPIVDEPGVWVEAIPDGRGGLVYAAAGDAAQIIWWWPAGAAEPLNVSFKPGRVLHDTAVLADRPTAVLVDNPDPSPEVEPEDYVQLLDLESGDTTTGRQVGGIEWGAAQVSYGDGTLLVTEVNHSCGDLVAFDIAGSDVALPGLPEPPCQVHFEVPFGGADFAGDGSFAYVAHSTEDTGEPGGRVSGAELVVVSDDGAEQRITLSEGEGRFGPVSYEGGWAVVTRPFRPDTAEPGDPLLVEVATGTVTAFDGNDAYSFRILTEPLQVG